MVTSSPFQMLFNVNPIFNSNLLFKLANAADDEENVADVQESDQTSFEDLGGSDGTEEQQQDDQKDSKDQDSDQGFDQT